MEEKNNNLALGVSFGFAGGAILGVILGLLTKNFALWLTIGVGSGIDWRSHWMGYRIFQKSKSEINFRLYYGNRRICYDTK